MSPEKTILIVEDDANTSEPAAFTSMWKSAVPIFPGG
jgi:hypothetical protein